MRKVNLEMRKGSGETEKADHEMLKGKGERAKVNLVMGKAQCEMQSVLREMLKVLPKWQKSDSQRQQMQQKTINPRSKPQSAEINEICG